MKMLLGKLKKVLIVFVVAVIALVFFALLLPATSGPGPVNESKLIQCQWVIKMWKSAGTNSPNFNFFSLSQDNKQDTVDSLSYYLVRTNFVWGDASNREVVIVCKKQFSDVHKPGFWNLFIPNPAHAVAYSDGTIGLISPKQFSNLNLDGFVAISYLATNSEFRIFK
jgi:hypothetical protein